MTLMLLDIIAQTYDANPNRVLLEKVGFFQTVNVRIMTIGTARKTIRQMFTPMAP